jgi:formylglycine-generating enzyme
MKRTIALLLAFTAAGFAFAQAAPTGFVLVRGGTFQMGDTLGKGFENEKPVHKVQVSSFSIGKCEVTQKEWVAIMGSNPSQFKADNLPVENVTWEDAITYCNKRSVKEKLTPCYTGTGMDAKCNFAANGYRLPTEAEWEYAARGGAASKGYLYAGGDDIEEVAWYIENGDNKTHPVGTKKANELGLFDMSGNVIEWCWDWYSDFTAAAQVDPRGPAKGEYKLFRGGNWLSIATHVRPTRRDYAQGVGFMFGLRGLRVVRTAK